MDFTRDPIVETIITPKAGNKLVVRNARSSSQEEYFVDALEVVSFGQSIFYRSLERPKHFLLPVAHYEVVEVREARMVFKHAASVDRTIKIAGGKAEPKGQKKERGRRKTKAAPEEEKAPEEAEEPSSKEQSSEEKKPRRRRRRSRKASEEEAAEESPAPAASASTAEPASEERRPDRVILPPPQTLISEKLESYRDSDLFKDIFVEEEASAPSELASSEGEEESSS